MKLFQKHQKILHSLVILLTVAINLSFFTDYTNATSQLTFVGKWGSTAPAGAVLSMQIAVGQNEHVYVVDTSNNRIKIFNTNGGFISEFGTEGFGNGEFEYPWGIAIGPTGTIYVSDSQNNRIQYFSPTGVFLGKFGSPGTGDGEFQYPHGLAVNQNGNVYVADSANHRIQRFTENGVYISQFGDEGSLPTQFEFPEDIAIESPSLNVYVSDSGNHTIKVFSNKGYFIRAFADLGTDDGKLHFPKGLSMNVLNELWVADTGNHRIQKFSSSGSYMSQTGSEGTQIGQFIGAQDLSVAPNGNVFVADGGNSRIQVFSDSGGFVKSFSVNTTMSTTDGTFRSPAGIIFSKGTGNAFVVDTKNDRIEVFDSDYNYMFSFGTSGTGNGEFNRPFGIAIASNGTLFVSDTGNNRIQQFRENGDFLNTFGSLGSGQVEFNSPAGIAFGGDNNLYVADTNNNRIQVVDISGLFVDTFGGAGTVNGQLLRPMDVDIDSFGKIYVADAGHNLIEVFDTQFDFTYSIGSFVRNINPNPIAGQLNSPEGVVVDTNANHIFVADTLFDRIQVFDLAGNVITQIGKNGNANAEFNQPVGIALGSNNHIYVVDSENDRVQEFMFNESVDAVTGGGTGPGGGNNGLGVVPSVIPQTVFPDIVPTTPIPPSLFPVTIENQITSIRETITNAIFVPVQKAVTEIAKITPVPLKTYIPKTLMNSGLLVGSIAMITDNLFATPITWTQFLLFPARLWSNILMLFGIKKRRRPWGTVYDTMTKQPLDPVKLELVNKDGYVVEKTTTDVYGYYSFAASPGHYMLRPIKEGFVFPSLVLAHTNRDEVYKNLYFGNYFEIKQRGELINKNVPMDRTHINWREFLREDQKLLNWIARRDYIISSVSHVLFIVGFIVSALALFLTPQTYTAVIFILYVVMYLIRRAGVHPSKLGRVVNHKTKTPLAFAIVRVFSVKLGNEVIRKVTNKYGQFFCPVPDGDYYLSFDRKNHNGTYTEANKKEFVTISRGVVSGKWEACF